jgi:hypothetical protein
VNAPSSIEPAPMHVRWSHTREISDMIVRMYLHRSVTSIPSSFSTAAAYAKLLMSGET